MPTLTEAVVLTDIRELGDTLGYPTANVEAAIVACADLAELKGLRTKWMDRKRAANTELTRKDNERFHEGQKVASLLKHGAELEEGARERRQAREAQSLGARWDHVLTQAAVLSNAATVKLNPATAPSADGALGPPGLRIVGDTVGTDAPVLDLTEETRLATILVEQAELRLDAHRGLIPPVDYVKMSNRDKDNLIDKLVGISSDTVSATFPFLGSARTIERARVEMAKQREIRVSPKYGTIIEEVQAA